MVRIILAILLLLPLNAHAFGVQMGISPSAANAVSYLINEDFEGTGAPTGWGTGPDYDYTTTVLQGAESMHLSGAQTNPDTSTWTGAGDIYVAMMFRLSSLPSVTTEVFRLYSETIRRPYFKIDASGEIRTQIYALANELATGLTLSIDTTYYVKMRYQMDNGANSELAVWMSTDGSNWTAGITNTGTQDTEPMVKLRWVDGEASQDFIIDSVRISESDINW